MMGLAAGVHIWLVAGAGATDFRQGMDSLCALVQTALADNPLSGHLHFPGTSSRQSEDFVARSGRPVPLLQAS